MMERDTDKSIYPETEYMNKLGNPPPTLPPDDLTTKQPDTPVGYAQLSTAEWVAPDQQGPLDREVRPDRARSNTTSGEELRDGAIVDNLCV